MSTAPRTPDKAQEERRGDKDNPRPPQHIDSGPDSKKEHHDARDGEHQLGQLYLRHWRSTREVRGNSRIKSAPKAIAGVCAPVGTPPASTFFAAPTAVIAVSE